MTIQDTLIQRLALKPNESLTIIGCSNGSDKVHPASGGSARLCQWAICIWTRCGYWVLKTLPLGQVHWPLNPASWCHHSLGMRVIMRAVFITGTKAWVAPADSETTEYGSLWLLRSFKKGQKKLDDPPNRGASILTFCISKIVIV